MSHMLSAELGVGRTPKTAGARSGLFTFATKLVSFDANSRVGYTAIPRPCLFGTLHLTIVLEGL